MQKKGHNPFGFPKNTGFDLHFSLAFWGSRRVRSHQNQLNCFGSSDAFWFFSLQRRWFTHWLCNTWCPNTDFRRFWEQFDGQKILDISAGWSEQIADIAETQPKKGIKERTCLPRLPRHLRVLWIIILGRATSSELAKCALYEFGASSFPS